MATLIPIFVCVVLPVSIVLIVFLASMNSDNKRAQILIKAIEANNGIDADKLAESLHEPRKTEREILNQRLLYGCIATFLGIAAAGYGLYATYSEDPDTEVARISYLVCAALLAVGLGYLTVYFVTRKQISGSDEEKQD